MLSVAIMSVGPFRSRLEPFKEFILAKRRARLTWEEIAQAIREQGVPCTRQAGQGDYKREKTMRVSMGFESAKRPTLKEAAEELRQSPAGKKSPEWASQKKH